jgi:hypothetical protein
MDAGRLHLAVCRRFGSAVRSADGKWDRGSPCTGWQARDVLEHVIGFHDVLLLRPLGLKPQRPRDDPQRRWDLTYERLHEALGDAELFRRRRCGRAVEAAGPPGPGPGLAGLESVMNQ